MELPIYFLVIYIGEKNKLKKKFFLEIRELRLILSKKTEGRIVLYNLYFFFVQSSSETEDDLEPPFDLIRLYKPTPAMITNAPGKKLFF